MHSDIFKQDDGCFKQKKIKHQISSPSEFGRDLATINRGGHQAPNKRQKNKNKKRKQAISKSALRLYFLFLFGIWCL